MRILKAIVLSLVLGLFTLLGIVICALLYIYVPGSLAIAWGGVGFLYLAQHSRGLWSRLFFGMPAVLAAAVWLGHAIDPWVEYRISEWSICDASPGLFAPALITASRNPTTGDFYLLIEHGFLDMNSRTYHFGPHGRFPDSGGYRGREGRVLIRGVYYASRDPGVIVPPGLTR